MQWSQLLPNILLFAICLSTVKYSSTNHLKKRTGWLKKNIEEFGTKQQDSEKNKRKLKPPIFGTNQSSLVLNEEAKRSKHDKTRSHFNPVTVSTKKHRRRIRQRTSNAFSRTQVKYPEKQQQDIVKSKIKTHGNQLRLSSDTINRNLSRDEASLDEFLNPKKRINKKTVRTHHIRKRKVNISKVQTTPNLNKPSGSSFNIPPACCRKKSCSGRCTGNVTEWRSDETLACYCDTACYEIFNDCCSDYTKYCGEQKPSNISIKRFKWTCETLGHFRSSENCTIGKGIWMVSRCADDWPRDRIRKNCENPAEFLQKRFKFERYIPLTTGNVTFQNYFCAKCNRIVGKFEYFPVKIKTNVIPPEHYNFSRKVDFLLSHGATEFFKEEQLTPKPFQKRRYCLKSIIDVCPSNATSIFCKNGPVEPVSGTQTFKNHHCALCNNPDGYYSCFPPTLAPVCHSTPPQRFLLNLHYQRKSFVISVLQTSCSSKGLIFDHKLQECFPNIPQPSGNEGKIRVLAWFAPFKDSQFTENDFKTVMEQYFGIEHSQINNVSIDTVPKKYLFQSNSTILFHLVSSTLLLNPEQILDILFKSDSKSSRLNLRSFIEFEKPLNVTSNNITYIIIKTTSRPLSCNTNIGLTREKFEFNKTDVNITMCEEYLSRSCKTEPTGLTKKDFVINANLSLYHKETGVVYKFGQFDMIGNSIVLCKDVLHKITPSSEPFTTIETLQSTIKTWERTIPHTTIRITPPMTYRMTYHVIPLDASIDSQERFYKATETTVVTNPDSQCPNKHGQIFDPRLNRCRPNHMIQPSTKPEVSSPSLSRLTFGQKQIKPELSYVDMVYTWLQPRQNSQNFSFAPTEFQESLTRYLNISQSQLFHINIATLPQSESNSASLYLVSSTIILTSRQRFKLLHTSRHENVSTQTKLIMNFIYFLEPFTLQIKGLSYAVIKTTSRPLVCAKKTTYTPEQYTLQNQDEVVIQRTNKTYGKFQYYRQNGTKRDGKLGNVTLCEKYIPTKCNGSTVLYATEEYIMMVNWSVYIKKTSSLYDYGEYENLSNKSVALCQYFKLHKITKIRKILRYNEVLGYITFVSFLISILFLIFLLVTYILFPQLQTLPGKNLMNFATSLLLFQIGWLLLNIDEISSDEPPCTAMAVMEHYFLIASFLSMSVIAFHTCKVFARRLPAPKMSESHERKLFCIYLALVWLLPGLYVGSCVVLDDQDVVKTGYGEFQICWLTEENADIYFVIIPIAVLLSFNVIAFITAAVFLRKHSQNKAARQASGNRRSKFLIYVKLSTLMGFAWLFGLLALVVKSTPVFRYFFVIFTSLEGVFVAMAFVLNTKTFGLYKQWYTNGSRATKTNRQK